jgi:hypothetical protein
MNKFSEKRKGYFSLLCFVILIVLCWVYVFARFMHTSHKLQQQAQINLRMNENLQTQQQIQQIKEIIPELPWLGCEYSLPNPDYRKHIVPPPKGPVTIVCCNTTKGPLSIEVHPNWAPNGANRFLFMVKDNFFSTNIALFRALKGFLVQFGIAGDPEVHKRYHSYGNLPDDPSWLPLGCVIILFLYLYNLSSYFSCVDLLGEKLTERDDFRKVIWLMQEQVIINGLTFLLV